MSSAQIAHESRLDRKRVLRALTVVRRAIALSVPATIEPANGTEREQVPGAPANSTSLSEHVESRSRSAALGLYAAHGHVWAEVVPDLDTDEVRRMLRERKGHGSTASPGLYRYIAVACRGRFHRLARPAAGRVPAPFGQVEGFWAYLQRQLKAKGGIRRERLGLYLAEYGWRYNHSKLSPTEQCRELLKLIR